MKNQNIVVKVYKNQSENILQKYTNL